MNALALPATDSTILKSFRPEKVYGSSLVKVAEIFEAVSATTRVDALAEVFQADPERAAVGIIDDQERAVGLIHRAHLFGLLGKPFGREILSRRTVADVCLPAERFRQNDNLFQTAESLQKTMDQSVVSYYLLVDDEGRFRGIFSSKDLLSFLSKMTQADIALAAQLQERLVKSRLSQADHGWAVEAFSQSAKGLGGDFYHVMPLADGRLFLALGDVSGKGVAASVLTSLLWGVLQFYDYRHGLTKLLTQVNEALIRTFHLEKYLTGLFLLYDPRRRELQVADMGHGHAWLIRDGKGRPLRRPGPIGESGMNLPLGIDLELRPQVFGLVLEKDDLVCLYTDGLTEQEGPDGEEFGEGRVLRTACHHAGDRRDLPETLLGKLSRHQGVVPRLDDVTWLQLEVK